MHGSFSPQIAVEIFKLRIPNDTTFDRLIWEAKQRGEYSVRGAYRILQVMNRSNSEGGSSSEQQQQGWWIQLWSMQIPHEIKMFAW